jgi:hypothetical protein
METSQVDRGPKSNGDSYGSVHFEYLYMGLSALDAVQCVQGDNWLGVALTATH